MTNLLRATLILLAMFSVPAETRAQTPFVKLETVATGNAGTTRVFFGRVVARQTVDLAFQVGGQIVDFPLEEGTAVPQGGLVADLDQEPFQLALDEAKANELQAHRTFDRYQKLVGSAVSETTLQDAETSLDLATIALRNAERALGQATLHAPFDAIVSARLVPNFSTISAGTPVVRLHDMSDWRIEIEVPETLFQQAGSEKTHVDIVVEFPAIDGVFPLEFREFNAETAQIGQTYTITLGMAPQDGMVILPGSSAKVTAVLNTGPARIEVPASAVIIENDGSASVMVFTPTGAVEGTVRRTPIEIAASDRGKVEVVSGIEPGQEIVSIGAGKLVDGDTVRRFAGFGNN